MNREGAMLEALIQIVKRVGEEILSRKAADQRAALSVTTRDVKHTLDLYAQECLIEALQALTPEATFYTEESSTHTLATEGLQWIIDPIDGTVNFYHGLAYWCLSVAAYRDGKPELACVYAPELGLCYAAQAGQGATCNGQVIHVAQLAPLDQSIIATGADRLRGKPQYDFYYFNRLARQIQRPRILGAAALDLCQVAHGKVDGSAETGIYLWDYAAGALIVQEAGGAVTVRHEPLGNRLLVVSAPTAARCDAIDALL